MTKKKYDAQKIKEQAQAKIRKDVEKALKTGVYEPKLTSPALKAWWEKAKAHSKKIKKAI